MPVQIGPYAVERELGRGGMGVVYLGHDARLTRKVAIKAVAGSDADSGLIARFDREARLLASLNHPNIASVYGLEQVDGSRYLVMEFVEGSTLSELVRSGPLPVDAALAVVSGIAAGVEAAHEASVIHRDLKPGNVMVTPAGVPKVLDFGLAKSSFDVESGSRRVLASLDHESPTVALQKPEPSSAATIPGRILGTAGYMSPEQARGRGVDRRADIWSLGCILFECLAGRSPFIGPTISDTIAAVIEREPDWKLLPPNTPPRIRELLACCLEKDPAKRMRDAGDVRLEIERAIAGREWTASFIAAQSAVASSGPGLSRRPRVAQLGYLAAGLLAGVAIGYLTGLLAAPTGDALTHTSVLMPGRSYWGSCASITPDGRTVVASSRDGNRLRLCVRSLSDPEPVEIYSYAADGPIDDGLCFTISPDGASIAMQDEQVRIVVLPITGGTPIVLAKLQSTVRGIAWSDDGYIYYNDTGEQPEVIWRVSARGGAPERVTENLKWTSGIRHRWPYPLPRGRGCLFVEFDGGVYENAKVLVWDAELRESRLLLENAYCPRILADMLFFARGHEVWAVDFDPDRLAPTAVAKPVLSGAHLDPYVLGEASFDLSRSGTLVYKPLIPETPPTPLVWVTRQGVATSVGVSLAGAIVEDISPDGLTAGLTANLPTKQAVLLDLRRGVTSRIPLPGRNWFGAFTSGGEAAVIKSNLGEDTGGSTLLYSLTTGQTLRRLIAKASTFVIDASSDGSIMLFQHVGIESGLFVLNSAAASPRFEQKFTQHGDTITAASLSPDGEWVAFSATDGLRTTAYIAPMRLDGVPTPLTTDGGIAVRWSPDGKEVYFWDNKGWLCRVATTPAPTGQGYDVGRVEKLFEATAANQLVPGSRFAVAPDGRFLMIQSIPKTEGSSHVNIVQNWLPHIREHLRRSDATP